MGIDENKYWPQRPERCGQRIAQEVVGRSLRMVRQIGLDTLQQVLQCLADIVPGDGPEPRACSGDRFGSNRHSRPLPLGSSTGDAIPTAIRDVCPVALSFAQRTDEAAVAALGADIRQFPEANPVSLQDPAYVGVASMVVQGRPRLCQGADSVSPG